MGPRSKQIDKALFDRIDALNGESFHHCSTDDICTPMGCVQQMLDYLPSSLWRRKNLKVLDPCCGNGNFGAYCALKTDMKNIWFNEINPIRMANCVALLKPVNTSSVNALELTGDFDLVMANPPYSGGANKNTSLSNKFIEKAIDLLKKKGYLCFITPNNWMTFNNNNTTLKRLLSEGSFTVIDNDAKKYFPSVGSSFTIFVWQKGVFCHKTLVRNNYLLKDTQVVAIPNTLPFIPLYLSEEVVSLVGKIVGTEVNHKFTYRCDLHNFTQRAKLTDIKTEEFPYETIHTARKTRYASMKQEIFDKWVIIVPLSTYYTPFIRTKVNTTQSVGYVPFSTEEEAEAFLPLMNRPEIKLMVHLTRYGNFNNIKVLKHLIFAPIKELTPGEISTLQKLGASIKY